MKKLSDDDEDGETVPPWRTNEDDGEKEEEAAPGLSGIANDLIPKAKGLGRNRAKVPTHIKPELLFKHEDPFSLYLLVHCCLSELQPIAR